MSVDLGTLEEAGTPVDMATYYEVQQFLYRESELVDDRRYHEWLDLFDDDLEYRAPVRIWRSDAAHQVDPVGCLWNDTKRTLQIRVERIDTGLAWTEQPPSVVRHFLSNLRVSKGTARDELLVRCNLLLTRNRGPAQPQDLIVGDRLDILRRHGESFKVSRRTVIIDSTNPDSQNLAMFF